MILRKWWEEEEEEVDGGDRKCIIWVRNGKENIINLVSGKDKDEYLIREQGKISVCL